MYARQFAGQSCLAENEKKAKLCKAIDKLSFFNGKTEQEELKRVGSIEDLTPGLVSRKHNLRNFPHE